MQDQMENKLEKKNITLRLTIEAIGLLKKQAKIIGQNASSYIESMVRGNKDATN